MSKPFLIISDAPTAPTGLGRITREITLQIHENMADVYRVATFGFGGTTSRALPFVQYPMTVTNNFVAPELVKVWNDFAGDEKGIILTIWNASWTWWLAHPEKLQPGPLREFLGSKPFELWGYFPIDGDDHDGLLPESIAETISGFDRVLAYTEWAGKAIQKSCASVGAVPALPHGLDTSVFRPRLPRGDSRIEFMKFAGGGRGELRPDLFLVGVVATNSPRKDWYLAFEACSELLLSGMEVGIWAHTDSLRKHWDLESLASEFGMKGRTIFTTHEMSDDELAIAYSSCDVTFGIGSGEGWGYPLAESLACGTPVIHGNYAGGAEFVPANFLVEPAIYRGDGFFGIRRPVFNARSWALRARTALRSKAKLPEYIDWKNAWPEWKKWLSGEGAQ